ncbi:MAG: 50S ribosomal protein L9 [Desulfurellaceae bacterium]|nr:50S ribosomal protein L9 [Desulfurellaceae bacterium]
MEIILQEEVADLGQIGDVVKVRDGYARNYLLPRGLAIQANRRNVRVLEHHKRLVAVKKERVQRQAQTLLDQLSALSLTIPAKAGEEGRLFGSVTNIDLETALKEKGLTLDRRKILLDEPIKQLGSYEVPVNLGGALRANIKLEVTAES